MNLKILRERAGLSQEYVAKIVRVNQAAVSNWERGLNPPLQKYREQLAQLYGCSVEDLLGERKET